MASLQIAHSSADKIDMKRLFLNPTFVLLFSITIGLVSSYLKTDLSVIPFCGIIIFFAQPASKLRELKGPYHVLIFKYVVTCISMISAIFIYLFAEDIVSGRYSLLASFENLKKALSLFAVLFAVFSVIVFAFGFLWKRVLKLNRVHLQILINQFSLPIIAFAIFFLTSYIFFVRQMPSTNDDIHWYHLLIIPTVLLIPWFTHISGLLKMSKEKGKTVSTFLYEYEVSRFESNEKFLNYQTYSRQRGKWVFLVPICILLLYQILSK